MYVYDYDSSKFKQAHNKEEIIETLWSRNFIEVTQISDCYFTNTFKWIAMELLLIC